MAEQRGKMEAKPTYSVAVVGATGAVGQEIVACLHRRNFPVQRLQLFASERSRDKYGSSEGFASCHRCGSAYLSHYNTCPMTAHAWRWVYCLFCLCVCLALCGRVVQTPFGDIQLEVFDVRRVREADIAFLAVSAAFSEEHAPALCANEGPVVIDMSSAFRYDDDVPLVVSFRC